MKAEMPEAARTDLLSQNDKKLTKHNTQRYCGGGFDYEQSRPGKTPL